MESNRRNFTLLASLRSFSPMMNVEVHAHFTNTPKHPALNRGSAHCQDPRKPLLTCMVREQKSYPDILYNIDPQFYPDDYTLSSPSHMYITKGPSRRPCCC